MNKKQFLQSLSDVYVRLGATEHGVGVVAIRTIPKGTDPFKNCDPFGSIIEIPEDEFESADAPEEAKQLVRDFCALQDGVYFVPDYGIDAIDKSFFLNHSDTANMETSDRGETFVAARDILPGEELTANYGEYHTTRHFKKAD
jgi:SET domain-containing protein